MYEKKGASVLYLASPTRNKGSEVEIKVFPSSEAGSENEADDVSHRKGMTCTSIICPICGLKYSELQALWRMTLTSYLGNTKL